MLVPRIRSTIWHATIYYIFIKSIKITITFKFFVKKHHIKTYKYNAKAKNVLFLTVGKSATYILW